MKISAPVLTVIRAAIDGLTVSNDRSLLQLPPLGAAAYKEVDTVLNNIGLHWKRSVQAHVGDASAVLRLRAAAASGTFICTRRDREFFGTPAHLCDAMADLLADRLPSDEIVRILEPSGGEGALVDAVLRRMPMAHITAVEKDSIAAAFLREKYGNEPRVCVVEEDFDSFEVSTLFHGVIMNPPFARARQHLVRAYAALNAMGELVAIMPAEAQDHSRPLGLWIAERDAYVEPIEAGAFRESGTPIATTLITVTRAATRGQLLRHTFATAIGKAHLLDRLEHLSFQLHQGNCRELSVPISEAERQNLQSHRNEADEIAHRLGAVAITAIDPRSGYGIGLMAPGAQGNSLAGHLIVPAIARPKTKAVVLAPTKTPVCTGDERLSPLNTHTPVAPPPPAAAAAAAALPVVRSGATQQVSVRRTARRVVERSSAQMSLF